MTVELIREEPPRKRGGAGPDFSDWLQAIRAHRGEWFRYPESVEYARSTAVIRGTYKGTEAGEYEARTTAAGGEGRNRRTIYARFVGATDPTPRRTSSGGAE